VGQAALRVYQPRRRRRGGSKRPRSGCAYGARECALNPLTRRPSAHLRLLPFLHALPEAADCVRDPTGLDQPRPRGRAPAQEQALARAGEARGERGELGPHSLTRAIRLVQLAQLADRLQTRQHIVSTKHYMEERSLVRTQIDSLRLLGERLQAARHG